MLKSIDLVEIRVKGWKAAVEWYQEKLGLKVAAWDPDDEYCQLEPEAGGCRLALYGVPGIDPGARPDACPPSRSTTSRRRCGRCGNGASASNATSRAA